MAVEKLTGPRLFQLIFLLVVLIAAFTWRTITYVAPEQSPVSNKISAICDITESACLFNIDNNQIIIDVEKRPIKQNSELTVITSGTEGEWKVEAKGISMNMGTLKFALLSDENSNQLHSVLVPKCKHNEMKWKINLSNDKHEINVIFNSIK